MRVSQAASSSASPAPAACGQLTVVPWPSPSPTSFSAPVPGELNRQITSLQTQQDELLNLRILKEIDDTTFARKSTELRDRIARLTLEAEANDRAKQEHGDIAVRAFELSQTLKEKWLSADNAAKRRLLEIVCLNYSLSDGKLVYQMRKPFDVLAEGPISGQGRGDWI